MVSQTLRLSGIGSYRREITIIVLGCILTAAFATPLLLTKALWLDEAWVADDTLRASFDPGALRTTPFGFALLVAGMVRVLPPVDVTFRLVPLAFGIATIPLGYFLARRLYRSQIEACLTVALLSTNLVFVTYCRMLKPYTADMFFTLLLIILAFRVVDMPTRTRWTLYGAALLVAPLVSFGVLLAIPVVAALLLLSMYSHPLQVSRLWAWLVVHSVFLVEMLLYYWTYLRRQRSGSLLTYWQDGFPPHAEIGSILLWYADQSRALIQYFLAPLSARWALVLGLAGALGLLRLIQQDEARGLLVLLGPLVVAAVAALFHLYPYGGVADGGAGRILLCALPGIVILVSGGLATVIRVTSHFRIPAVGILIALVAFIPALQAAAYSATLSHQTLPGDPSEESRKLVQGVLLPHVQRGDEIFVYYGVADAFQVCAPRFRQPSIVSPPMSLVHRQGVTLVFGAYPWDIRRSVALTHPKRIWLLLAHVNPALATSLVDTALRLGHIDLAQHAIGADLYRLVQSSHRS